MGKKGVIRKRSRRENGGDKRIEGRAKGIEEESGESGECGKIGECGKSGEIGGKVEEE